MDIEFKFCEIFPDIHAGEIYDKLVAFAVDDVFETSALSDGDEEYSDGDISLACQRSLLHYLGHPDY
jgi:hypothetical protein